MSKHKQDEIDSLASAIGEVATSQSKVEVLICEEEKLPNELPDTDEINILKAHGNRHLVMKGKKSNGLLGHIDRIPNVNVADMSSDPEKDGHHAYGVSYRKGKGGVSNPVTRRLGKFSSHDEALAAVKKFHKLP